MKHLHRLFAVAFAAFFIVSAHAQNAGTVTNHAFVLGKGAGTTGYTSLLCTSAQLAVGQSAADPICRTLTGDVTITAAGVTAIGASKVTNSQLATMAANTTKCNATAGTANPTDCTASTMRTNLGLVIGTNVQAWDTDLDCLAALSSTGVVSRTGGGTCSAGALALSGLATGTQDTVIGYWGSTTATAIAINNCTGALTYSTTTHTFGCNAAAGTGTVTSVVVQGTAGATAVSGTCTITTTGTCTVDLASGRKTLPTTQTFTSASGTYTTPANVLWIEVEMYGGGSGGNGSGAAGAGLGVVGGATTFSTFSANGGLAPASQTLGGGGGTASGGYLNRTGGAGGVGSGVTTSSPGGAGCVGPYGGGGQSGSPGAGQGGAGAANSGSGGGGGGVNTTANGGGGGGCGGFLRAIINTPAASYSYAVGAGGTAGAAGTGGATGGAGGSGFIQVIEHYGS